MAYQLFSLPKQTNISSSFTLSAGAKAYFFEPGSTTPQNTYQDSALTTPHAHPVVADAAGVFAPIFLNPALQYKLTLNTAADALIYTVDPINDQVLSQAIIGELFYPRTPSEIAAGVTPTNYAYPPGHDGRFGLLSDSSTDNTAALQNLINGSSGSVPVRIRRNGAGYYRCIGRITVPANTTIFLEDGAEIRWSSTSATGTSFLGAASRPGIEITGDNFRIEGKGVLRGPSSASFVSNEIGIFAKGTSTSARKNGFTVRDVELLNWGASGIVAQFVDRVDVQSAYAHDCGYSGIHLLSCTHFRLSNNRVKTITPGAGGNCYGISCTHDSTGYSTDPNIATPRLVAHPFCIDGDISANTIEDVPVWTGIDCHGGYELSVARNKTYNCRIGIAVGGSSGDAANYAGENNAVLDNFITTLKADDSATGISATDRYGVIVAGGTTVPHSNVTVRGNTISGYGDTVVSSFVIHAHKVRNAIIDGNIILNWRGNAIYTSDGDGIISNNLFGGVASATNACCVFLETTTGSWDVIGNKHRPVSGTASNEGLRINNGSNPRCLIAGNDFDYATTPYVAFDGTQTRCDSQIVPQITASGTPTSVDISPAGRAPRVRIVFSTSGISTLTDFTNARIGQVIECYFATTNATTIDRTNAALAGGANFASSQYDTLVLECIANSGVKFVERSRAANS